jgi:long-chain acyl-CoA synthetase
MTVCDLLRSSASRHADRPAVSHRGQGLNYRQLWRRAASLAGVVADSAGRPGSRVGLLLPSTLAYGVAYFAVLLAGDTVVPVCSETTPAELAATLGQSQPSLVITTTRLGIALDAVRSLQQTRRVCLTEGGEVLNAAGATETLAMCERHLPGLRAPAATLAQITYTSGTSGRPKGVMLTHANLLANTQSIVSRLAMSACDSVLTPLHLCFAYGTSVLLTHVACGAEVVLVDDLVFGADLLSLAGRCAPASMSAVPSHYLMLLRAPSLAQRLFQGMRYITSAGGHLPASAVKAIHDLSSHLVIHVMYGQTEASARLAIATLTADREWSGTVGSAVPGVRLHIARDDGTRAGPGEVGEVVAAGDNVMVGYYNAPQETKRVLRADGLHTGDLGYLDDRANLHLLGRGDDVISCGGFRISPVEIEEVLCQVEGIAEVAVRGEPDSLLGQAPAAYVVLADGRCGVTAGELLARCNALLPKRKRLRHLHLIAALPKTRSGKVQRSRLVRACSDNGRAVEAAAGPACLP